MKKINLGRTRLLLVDPNPDSLELTSGMLAMTGAQSVRKLTTTTQAIEALRQGPFDIVITEETTAPLNGLEFTAYLRTSEMSPNRRIPILLMAAHADSAYVARARDHGVTEFLVKPLSIDRLLHRLTVMVARPRPFIDSESYFGPDRRRRDGIVYSGTERRRSENRSAEEISPGKTRRRPHDHPALHELTARLSS